MTSFREPDYDLALKLIAEDFKKIAGIAFTCRIIFGDRRGRFSGMLIVPEGDGFAGVKHTTEAWLWADRNLGSPIGTRVRITIDDPCDPMFFERFEELSAHKGLRITGLIAKIRSNA